MIIYQTSIPSMWADVKKAISKAKPTNVNSIYGRVFGDHELKITYMSYKYLVTAIILFETIQSGADILKDDKRMIFCLIGPIFPHLKLFISK